MPRVADSLSGTVEIKERREEPVTDVMRRRGARGLVVAAVAAVAAVGTVAPAEAVTRKVKIVYAQYDSPGSDTGSNTSLNAEWIQLRNRCSTSRSLTNAKIKDAAGHTYTFGRYALGGGRYVKVHTGKGSNTATNRYQGRSWYVWNNDKDTAYLSNASGTRLDSCSYNNRSASSVYC
jgi:hypothetical protein